MSDCAFLRPAHDINCKDTVDKQVYIAFCIGMMFNLASIFIGNPYIISLLAIPIAAVMTFRWLNNPLPWIVLVSVFAANPVNLDAPISLNLYFAIFLLVLKMQYLDRLPSWIYLSLLTALISIIGSIINWSATSDLSTQIAAIINYILGPFFLIPLIYFRLQSVHDSDSLIKGIVLSLIIPSISYMLLAHFFGDPTIDKNSAFEDFINVNTYHLGNVDINLIRTQAGIPLAVFICSSFSIILCAVSNRIRQIAAIFLILTIFLLLVTGSVGSSLAALCGIMLLLYIARRYMSLKRYVMILPIAIVFALVGWSQLPQEIKDYAGSRYEERFSGTGVDTSDRSERWLLSLEYLLKNPEGRGWDLYVAPIGVYPHNEYLSYGIAFGIICSFIYLVVPAKILFFLLNIKIHSNNPAQLAILLAGIGAITVFLINSFTDHLSANRWYFNVVWSIIWYCYFTVRVNSKSYGN